MIGLERPLSREVQRAQALIVELRRSLMDLDDGDVPPAQFSVDFDTVGDLRRFVLDHCGKYGTTGISLDGLSRSLITFESVIGAGYENDLVQRASLIHDISQVIKDFFDSQHAH